MLVIIYMLLVCVFKISAIILNISFWWLQFRDFVLIIVFLHLYVEAKRNQNGTYCHVSLETAAFLGFKSTCPLESCHQNFKQKSSLHSH